ncbi:tape measure protein [Tepidanaerobacter syntrophicus]|uniref:tape measure protein n=1 Tax=Tepidanaerobacter syntrophicus TaxID=224999 RepID=UPI001BD68C39|nr:tape measure protein [Tepidanaerobacter syntrophicus]
MAENEIYRVEIPIIVNDQSEAPLSKAKERVNKFEQEAQKANQQIRKHFQEIAKMQIEPIMKIRDNLTAGVLKADNLIKKLDLAQASPIITAQDRVSAVVTRINGIIEAMDGGRIDVIADMKGPLMDEIVKAKESLSVLDAVKAGPIAELRGELFGQLSKATSQIRWLDMARAEPQATLRERVTWKVREIGGSLRNITEKVWTVTMVLHDKASSALNSAVSTLRNVVSKLTSPLMLLGAGAGATAAIAFPLKLAGEFEQARMSLDFYMGGVKEGQKAFEDLVDFAAKTPFEFPFLQSMTVQLMGTGYNFEQAKRALTAFGDAAGRTGAGMEGISNAMVGFTQIASAGTLNLQDLKQVALNLKLPLNIFAKELGVAESAMGDIGRAGISSQKAMEAIVRTLEKRYAGGLEQLSGSFEGLLSTIKDTARLTVWHFGKGMMDPVKRIMNDIIGLTEDSGKGFEKFQQRLEKLGKNVGESFEDAYKKVKRFIEGYASNPKFQNLSFSGKVNFVIQDIGEMFGEWFGKTGAPTIAKYGVMIGSELMKATLNGAMASISQSPLLALLLGTYVGMKVPGPATVKAVVAISIAASPFVLKALEWLTGGKERANEKIQKEYQIQESAFKAVEKQREYVEYENMKRKMAGQPSLTWEEQAVYKGTELKAKPTAFSTYSRILKENMSEEQQKKADMQYKTFLETIDRFTSGTDKTTRQIEKIYNTQSRAFELIEKQTQNMEYENIKRKQAGQPPLTPTWEEQAIYKGTQLKARALGGIFSTPHMALVAEAGPEAIIPLSSRMRDRALGLWREAGERLGVRPYAEGGLISLTPAVATSSYSAPVTNVTNYIEVSVGGSNADPEDIANAVGIKLESVFKNMPKK